MKCSPAVCCTQANGVVARQVDAQTEDDGITTKPTPASAAQPRVGDGDGPAEPA
jgi:hypothetical protein